MLAESFEGIFYAASGYDNIQTSSHFKVDDPAEGVVACNECFAYAVILRDFLMNEVTGKDDSAHVRPPLQFLPEISYQHIVMAEGLNVLYVCGNTVSGVVQLRQHENANICILVFLNQFFVELEVVRKTRPVHQDGVDQNVLVNVLSLLLSDQDVFLVPHEDEIKAIFGQEPAVLLIVFTISDDSPRVISIFIVKLRR